MIPVVLIRPYPYNLSYAIALGVLADGKVTAYGRKGTLPFSWGNRGEFP
jgi:hypothetical protein